MSPITHAEIARLSQADRAEIAARREQFPLMLRNHDTHFGFVTAEGRCVRVPAFGFVDFFGGLPMIAADGSVN